MVILIPFLIFVKFSQIWISCVFHEAVGSPSRINDVKKRTTVSWNTFIGPQLMKAKSYKIKMLKKPQKK